MAFIKRVLSFFFLFFSLVCVGYFAQEVYRLIQIQNSSEAEKLAIIWQRDLDTLIEQKKLHPGWEKIREVALIAGTAKAREWLKEITSPVNVNIDGDHRLEVLLLNWEDEGKQGAIVQYNLIDLQSGNMVWELGRTFVLKESQKQQVDVLAEAPIEADRQESTSAPPAPASDSNKPSQE